MKHNSSKIAHFPIKNYYNLHFTTTPNNYFFHTVPHSYFSSKYRTTLIFIETFTTDKIDTCATILQNSTNYVASFPTGNIAYIEVPITNEKHKYYQVHDINSFTDSHQQIQHLLHLTQLLPQNSSPHLPKQLIRLPQMQLKNSILLNLLHIVHKSFPFMIHLSLKKTISKVSFTQ